MTLHLPIFVNCENVRMVQGGSRTRFLFDFDLSLSLNSRSRRRSEISIKRAPSYSEVRRPALPGLRVPSAAPRGHNQSCSPWPPYDGRCDKNRLSSCADGWPPSLRALSTGVVKRILGSG